MRYCYERISFVCTNTRRARVRSFPCCRLFIRGKIHSVSFVHVFLRYVFETFFFLFFPRFAWYSRKLYGGQCSTDAAAATKLRFRPLGPFLRKLRFRIFITEIMTRLLYTSSVQLVHPRDETSAESGNPLARTFNIRGYLFYARVTLDSILLANNFASSRSVNICLYYYFIF